MKRKKSKKTPLETAIQKYNRNISQAEKRNPNELFMKIDKNIISNLSKGEKSTLTKALNSFSLRNKPKKKTSQNKEYRTPTQNIIKTLENIVNKRISSWNEKTKTSVLKLNGQLLPNQNQKEQDKLLKKNFNITTKSKLDLMHYAEGLFSMSDPQYYSKRVDDMKINYLEQMWVQVGVYDPESYLEMEKNINEMSADEFLRTYKENAESTLPFVDSPKSRGRRGGMFTVDLDSKVSALRGVWG